MEPDKPALHPGFISLSAATFKEAFSGSMSEVCNFSEKKMTKLSIFL